MTAARHPDTPRIHTPRIHTPRATPRATSTGTSTGTAATPHTPRPAPAPATERGSIALIAALALIPLALLTALVVDAGRTWVTRTALATGVEAAAVASAQTWGRGGDPCAADDLTLVNANAPNPSELACTTTGTRRNGLVEVSARHDHSLQFGGLLGRPTTEIRTRTSVLIGAPTSVRDIWPFALCLNHPAVAAWVATGMTGTSTAEITFASQTQYCAGDAPGNWGTLNLDGGSSSDAKVRTWVLEGYPGWIEIGDEITGIPGSPSTNLQLDSGYGRTIVLALFDEARGTGANATYTIRGFAIADFVSARFTGANAQRSLTIRFRTGVVEGGVGGAGAPELGLSSWRICAQDGIDTC